MRGTVGKNWKLSARKLVRQHFQPCWSSKGYLLCTYVHSFYLSFICFVSDVRFVPVALSAPRICLPSWNETKTSRRYVTRFSSPYLMIGNLPSFRQSPAQFLMTFDRAAIIFQGYRLTDRDRSIFPGQLPSDSRSKMLLSKFNRPNE